MENTEIMRNDEVVEAAEEIVSASSGNGLKILGGGVIITAIGFGIYKLVKKIKSKKSEQKDAVPTEDYDLNENVVEFHE